MVIDASASRQLSMLLFCHIHLTLFDPARMAIFSFHTTALHRRTSLMCNLEGLDCAFVLEYCVGTYAVSLRPDCHVIGSGPFFRRMSIVLY